MLRALSREDIASEDSISVALVIEDGSGYMERSFSAEFRTKRLGTINIIFEDAEDGSACMTVKQTTSKGTKAFAYTFGRTLFAKAMAGFMAGYAEDISSGSFRESVGSILDSYNTVIQHGTPEK